MSLASTALQILDKLADVVVGPAKGTILATSTLATPVVVPQGLTATLPDGRVVRVIQGKRVGATPVEVSVRLFFLSGSAQSAGNFSPVSSGLVATWHPGTGASGPVAVPDGLQAWGTTSMFGFTQRAANLRVGSCVEACELRDDADLFKCGAQGGVSLVLLDAETSQMKGAGTNQAGDEHIELRQAMWRLRVNISTLAPQRGRRVPARDMHDSLIEILQGATAGDDQIVIDAWRFVRRSSGVDSWELSFFTKSYSEGRSLQPEALANLPLFTKVNAGIILPGDTDQPAPFRVRTAFGTSRGFSTGFDQGFGSAYGGDNVGFNAGFDQGFG